MSALSTLRNGNVGTTLYTITPSTGAAVSVGTLAFTTAGIGRDPITGRVYYAESALPGRIAYWDPTTATNTVLPTSLGFVTNRMGFRADGQMFSMNPSINNICVIDRNTGNPTIVATVQSVPLSGTGDMALAPNGDLYTVTSSTTFRVLQNLIDVPPAGAVPAIATTSGASGTIGSPNGITFITNGVALGSPTTGIVDLGLNGGFTNARGANSYSDLGAMPKFADIAISTTPSSSNFARTGSASYAVNVVNNGPQSASGNFSVNSGTVATTNGGTAASSSATLVVLSPPTVVKRFDRRAAAQCLGAGHVHGSSRALRPTRQQRRHNHGDCGCTMPPTSPADLNPRSPSRGKVECWDRSIARVTAAGAHGAIGAAV